MTFAILFGLFSLVCMVLAFTRHPIYGFYFYLATTYVYPQGRWWGYLFGDMRWALLSAAVTALAIVLHAGKLKVKPLWLGNGAAALLLLYCALMWLQTPLAIARDDHIAGAGYFTKSLIAFWVVYRIVDSKERVRDLLLAHVLGCGVLGLLSMMVGRQNERLDGVGGPGLDDANTLGMYLATGLIAAAGLVLTQRGWRRWLSLGCIGAIANGFVLANSRGSMLGLAVGGLILMWCKAQQHRRVFWAMTVAVALIGAVIVDAAFVERMFTISQVTTEEADSSAQSRVELAKAQLQMFLDHPIGVGHRGTPALSRDYLDEKWLSIDLARRYEPAERSSHNTFLTALVEQGVFGAILYLALVMWIVGAVWRARRWRDSSADPELITLGATVCAALAAVIVAGNTADYLLVEVQFWLLAALVSVRQLMPANAAVLRRDDAGGGIHRVPA